MKKRNKVIAAIAAVCALLIISGIVYHNATKKLPVPAIRENLDMSLTEDRFYLSEENFKEAMQIEVEPYLNKYMTDGYVKNGDIDLYYRMYQTGNSEKSMVICHGFTEYAEKYNETIYYFLNAGYDVYIMEYRGHGQSTREVEDKSLAYVETFDDYQADFKIFMDEIVVPNSGSNPLYLFAHSMGGGIATRFLEEYPKYFKSAVLSAPMMDVKTGSTPEFLANAVAEVFHAVGKGEAYVFGEAPYAGPRDIEKTATLSRGRYDYYLTLETDNELHHVSGAAFSWLKSAIDQTQLVLKKENLEKIKIPVLVFEAENDTLVESNGLYKLVNGLENVTFKFAPGAKHQIFSANNDIVIPYYNTVLDFYEKNQ